MGSNPTGFKITDTAAGWSGADFEDVFVRKDCFLEGGLWSWGNARVGLVGDNTTIRRSSPVQTISGGTNWKSLATAGDLALIGAIKTDGTLWLWGTGTCGGLGNNAVLNQSSPVQTISGGTNWKSVSTSSCQTAAIKTDGTLWMWGNNVAAQLGDNTRTARSSPVQTISGGNNWRSVSAGGGSTASITAAIKTDGTLWLWGLGTGGGLGTNSQINQSSPVQTISGGTNWRSVSASGYGAAAIKTDGTLWLWGGDGIFGSPVPFIGDNTVIGRSSPVQTVSGGTNWKSVSIGQGTAAIKTDGTLWLWGTGADGRLGNNSTINQSSPVQTISGGTNWRSVNSTSATAAIKTDGTLWVWGDGPFGSLGDNTVIARSSPVQTISGGTNWRSVVTSTGLSAAIREDCW
jgi:hypothetical protein